MNGWTLLRSHLLQRGLNHKMVHLFFFFFLRCDKWLWIDMILTAIVSFWWSISSLACWVQALISIDHLTRRLNWIFDINLLIIIYFMHHKFKTLLWLNQAFLESRVYFEHKIVLKLTLIYSLRCKLIYRSSVSDTIN